MEAVKVDDYEIDVLIQGFPGRMVCHGGLGWSTVAMIRGRGHVALVDVGSFNMRKGLIAQLAKRGLEPADVTDVVLTHSHYDHSLNWILFRQARIIIGARELTWSMSEPRILESSSDFCTHSMVRSMSGRIMSSYSCRPSSMFR